MSHTFGYFTDHPVARLNRERLTMTLREIAERTNVTPAAVGRRPPGRRMDDQGRRGSRRPSPSRVLRLLLHHLPDVPSHLRALGEWLPPGSIVVVNEENPRSSSWFLKNAVRSVIQRDTKEEHQMSHKRWSGLLAAAGFEPVGDLRGADLLPGVPVGMRWSQVFSYRKS